jgi:predicted nucleic acid-binding protein
MTTAYVDTSVLGRVLLDEPDATAIVGELGRFDDLVSSRLLAVELRRLALRRGFNDRATELLADITLLPVDEATLTAAETVAPAGVATLDAIHLTSAMQLARGGDLDALMTYDAQLAAGAEHHGIRVIALAG